MKELNQKQLVKIKGGNVTPALLNALVRSATTVLDLGRSLGSAIRRAVNGRPCPV